MKRFLRAYLALVALAWGWALPTPGAQATLDAVVASITTPAWGDGMASNSSRGPRQYDLIKPDYAAPGTNSLAA